jgi:OmpA-OmpF porin, OOP family
MNNRYVLLFTIAFLAGNVLAQPNQLGARKKLPPVGLSTNNKRAIVLYEAADNFRVRREFSQAINLLNEAIDKDKKFFEAWYRLGITYMTLRDFKKAISNLEHGVSLTSDPKKKKIFWYDLAESYISIGNYDKAEEYAKAFLQQETTNRDKIDNAGIILRNAQFSKANLSNSSQYKQKKLSDTVNSFVMQYFPVLTADQQSLIFTRRFGGTNHDDEDLVVSRKTANGRWGVPESISDSINSQLDEGTCTISADGRKLIFTSCSGRNGLGRCDLYESTKIGNEWSNPKNLGPNVNTISWESQPSLSADGKTLYFVSTRRGGVGRCDIWVSKLNDKGQWGRAENLGKPINTPFDEMSPFIHVNNRTLYFTSNGLPGFGALDIFYSERDQSKWSEPVNFGTVTNNHENQYSLFITADGRKGYYSHEESKEAEYTSSHIYEIEIPEDHQVKFKSNYVKGIVRDKDTHRPLLAKIELINLEKNEVESLVESDSLTGDYLMVLTQGAEYALYVNKQHYLFQSLNFNYSEIKNFEPIVLNIDLERVKEGSIAILENIFFDHDKYDLKERSMTELQKITKFLIENGQTRVEIGGHTDNSGAAAYNKQLSEKRAQSVYNYLINNGVPATRLTIKGYGSDKPIAPNSDESGRQKNRRIEFKLIR